MGDVGAETAAKDADDPLRQEIRIWLHESWDPTLTLRQWWERLAEAGWSAPFWPKAWYGRDLPRSVLTTVVDECVAAGVPGPPWGVAYDLAAPILMRHGTEQQKLRHVWRIVSGQESWCQLFSEPGAGSDLAGLRTRAVRDGDEWVITGQKVWTTLAHHADFGMLLARTDPEVPKHSGISWFIFEMDQPGVEIRPLRQMNGKAEFNEVFLEEARVSHHNIVGGLNRGWDLAKTTFSLARAFNARNATGAEAGSKAGHLDRPAIEFVARPRPTSKEKPRGSRLIPLAQEWRRTDDPVVRQDLAHLYTLNQIRRYNALRLKSGGDAGRPQIASGQKITELDTAQFASDLGCRILGPFGMLSGDDAAAGGLVGEMLLTSPSIGIAGGTNDIVRNVLAERVLGLPRERDQTVDVPFKDVPTGT